MTKLLLCVSFSLRFSHFSDEVSSVTEGFLWTQGRWRTGWAVCPGKAPQGPALPHWVSPQAFRGAPCTSPLPPDPSPAPGAAAAGQASLLSPSRGLARGEQSVLGVPCPGGAPGTQATTEPRLGASAVRPVKRTSPHIQGAVSSRGHGQRQRWGHTSGLHAQDSDTTTRSRAEALEGGVWGVRGPCLRLPAPGGDTCVQSTILVAPSRETTRSCLDSQIPLILRGLS